MDELLTSIAEFICLETNKFDGYRSIAHEIIGTKVVRYLEPNVLIYISADRIIARHWKSGKGVAPLERLFDYGDPKMISQILQQLEMWNQSSSSSLR